jgi:hypothetical protein
MLARPWLIVPVSELASSITSAITSAARLSGSIMPDETMLTANDQIVRNQARALYTTESRLFCKVFNSILMNGQHCVVARSLS